MRLLYSLGGYVFHTAMRLVSPWHRKAQAIVKGRREIASRLREHIDPSKPVFWVHASSLGEFEQGRPLLELWRERYPHWQIVQTFFSPSGYEVRSGWSGADVVTYLPADTERGMEEFLHYANPTVAVFVKYDLWPILLTKLQERKVPTYLISAIFREKQLFFKPWGKWYLDLLRSFQHIYVQDQSSADLLQRYGLEDVDVEGDTRFDRVWTISKASKRVPAVERMSARGKRIIVAGSTWPADEAFLLNYLHRSPEVLLVIAPHEVDSAHISSLTSHIERPWARISQIDTLPADQEVDCLVVDKIGLLSSLYKYASVAYIGGGFGRGIHNTLEAAVYGLPILWGPNYKKFREAQELLSSGAGFTFSDQEDLDQLLGSLFSDEGKRLEAGAAAKAYVERNLGSAERIVSAIERDNQLSRSGEIRYNKDESR